MIIQDIESLKTWLTQTLTPICNADAATLSKYVVALVKKDLPQTELRALCLDQLDVFLHEKCHSFVDVLFDALTTKSYLEPAPAPVNSIAAAPYTPSPSRQDAPPAVTAAAVPIVTDHRKLNEPIADVGDTNKDGGRRRHSRSLSPRQIRRTNYPNRHDHGDRGVAGDNDRWRRHDNRGRHYGRDDRRRRSRSRSPRRSPRNRPPPWSVKDKPRRSPPGYQRSRSKSPPHPKNDLRKLITGSTISIQPPRHDSRSPTPIAENGARFDVVDPPASSTGAITVVTNAGADKNRYSGSRSPNQLRLRCRDYDEKGYCMRGDMCPFDHGSDPLVVEEIDMPADIPFGPNAPGSLMQSQPGPSIPSGPPPRPMVQRPPIVPGPPGMPPGAVPMGPQPPPTMRIEPYQPEGYNPEDPGITPPRMPVPPPFWPPHPPHMPLLPGILPPIIPRFLPPPVGRDLVTLTHTSSQEAPAPPRNVNRIVLPPKHEIVTLTTSATDGPLSHATLSAIQDKTEAAPAHKKSFDFKRLGNYRKPGYNLTNMTLEVRKIPREFNTILKLNEHFSKFGTLVNVQVSYNNDPEAALVTFARHCDAQSAYRSSDPLFHNRFIKVFWYSPEENSNTSVAETTKSVGGKPRITIPPSHKLQFKKVTPADSVDKSVVLTNEGHLKRTVVNAPPSDDSSHNVGAGDSADAPDVVEVTSHPDPEAKTIALKKNLEIQKQKQLLLKKYLDHQKLLISKLETKKNSEEKSSVMKTIKSLAEKIDKLQLELAPKKIDPSKSISEAKRELLDAELDLITKENSGMDTTDLRMKLNQLQKRASSLGLMSKGRGRGRGWRGRRGGWSFTRGGHHRLSKMSRTIDRRSKQIEVSGFNNDTRDDLLPHLTQHGAVETISYDENQGSALVTFKTRMDAEKASIKGIKFGDQVLKMRWHEAGAVAPTLQEETHDPLTQSLVATEDIDEDALLAADDEEEDDEESRSWRR